MNSYQIKDKIDDVIFQCFNFLSDIIFFFKFNLKTNLKTNQRFENIHAGERCFILGTGPSLSKLTDCQIDNLKNELIFGVNSFYKAKIADHLNPTYYVLFDNLYWEEEMHFFEDVLNKFKSKKPIFLTDYRARHIVENLGVASETMFLYNKKYPINTIDSELSKNMYIGQNVISTSILIAIKMGFKEIYLLGCDYNSFATTNIEHCYNDADEKKYNTENLAFYLKFYALTTRIHYLIAKHATNKGVKIVNITPGSLLDAYPRKDISTVI